jgi:hypothetical protein
MITQDEINELNCASAEREAREDWAKEQRRVELRTEERFGSRPARPHYFPETTKEDILSAIEADNLKASRG